MNSPDKLHKLSREELYQKVWLTSGVKLSKELEVSDVAVFKRCRRLNVPRPPRGYWAKIEAGHQPKRPPLPPFLEAAASEKMKRAAARRTNMPADPYAVHPLSEEFLRAVESAKLSYDKKRVHLRERALPEADISKELAPKAARAFNMLLQRLEPLGIKFGKSLSKYEGGRFRLGNDRVQFKIEEDLVEKPADVVRRGRFTYSSPDANKVLSGKLSFTLKAEQYSPSRIQQRWVEDEKAPLDAILSEIVKFICDYFVGLQKRREAEEIEREKQRVDAEIRWKKQQEEEARRRQEELEQKQAEARRKHPGLLEGESQHRRDDLAKAAEWWRLHQSVVSFIAECERRWQNSGERQLTQQQQEWLAWALETAKAMSPFENGYPDPARDGTFDPADFPFGGPWPETRKFPQPPTMPQMPAPVVVQQSYGSPSYSAPAPKPYPFWLKYQR